MEHMSQHDRRPLHCGSYFSGHETHWIPALKVYIKTPRRRVELVDVSDDGWVTFRQDGKEDRYWHHDVAWIEHNRKRSWSRVEDTTFFNADNYWFCFAREESPCPKPLVIDEPLTTDDMFQMVKERGGFSLSISQMALPSITPKPLVLLDVDGVINDLGEADARPWKTSLVESHDFTLRIPEFMPDLIRQLTRVAEVRWCTSWKAHANDEIMRHLGIGRLPVVDGTGFWSVEAKGAAAHRLATAALEDGRQVYWIEDFGGQPPRDLMPDGVVFIDTDPDREGGVLTPELIPAELLEPADEGTGRPGTDDGAAEDDRVMEGPEVAQPTAVGSQKEGSADAPGSTTATITREQAREIARDIRERLEAMGMVKFREDGRTVPGSATEDTP